MAEVTLKGTKVKTSGELPGKSAKAFPFKLVKSDLSEVSLSDFSGKKVILNIFPSVDTGTCATSVRTFNKRASALENTVVVCISNDLPFAFSRFCGAEGIENVITLSGFRDDSFQKDYGVELVDGPLAGLMARSIVVIDESGTVVHSELVSEIVDEPNYDTAIQAL